MSDIATTCAKILLLAIALFFLGPQLGSLDIDSDGVPDVPVMVMHTGSQNVQASKIDGQARIVLAAASRFDQIGSDPEVLKRNFGPTLIVGLPDSITPLLC